MSKSKVAHVDLVEFDSNYRKSHGIIAGVDEAGRGPLAGPVVAAAVIMRDVPEGVFDSKALSPKKRDLLYEKIFDCSYVGIGLASPEEIDLLNILQATRLAMNRALACLRVRPDYTIVDGKYLNLDLPNECIVSGDRLSASIGAASIIAKVYRDRLMCGLDRLFPEYMFGKHKGYGTSLHLERLEKYGPVQWHRLTFRPVARCMTPAIVSRWFENRTVSGDRLFRAGFLPARR